MESLQFLVTIKFNPDEIDEVSVSEVFDSAVEGVYLDGIEDVTCREV
jgi:hypothetical protein